MERELLRLINAERQENGLGLLKENATLSERAKDLSERTTAGETPKPRTASDNGEDCRAYTLGQTSGQALGENTATVSRVEDWLFTGGKYSADERWYPAAYLADGEEAAERIVQEWMEDPRQKAVMLDPSARAHGVGIRIGYTRERGWAAERITATHHTSACRVR